MSETKPNVSTLTKLYYATTRNGEKNQIAYVQEIPQLKTAPEPITYSAIDIEDERQAKGRKKAETLEISALFTEEQHDEILALETADTEVYWFVQLPESTATTPGSPLTFDFRGKCAIALDTIAIDDMLKDKITIYRSSAIQEGKGFPTASI